MKVIAADSLRKLVLAFMLEATTAIRKSRRKKTKQMFVVDD